MPSKIKVFEAEQNGAVAWHDMLASNGKAKCNLGGVFESCLASWNLGTLGLCAHAIYGIDIFLSTTYFSPFHGLNVRATNYV